MQTPPDGHEPVLMEQTRAALRLRPGLTVLDCTVGRGGHARMIADGIAPGGTLLALDADPANLAFARGRLADASVPCRFFHANFADAPEVLEAAGLAGVDRIFADLGVSTNQLLDNERGLAFSTDAPLDMRLDPRIEESAADLLARLPEEELANLLFELAQERFSRRIARKIVQTQSAQPIRTTERLARVVRDAIPRKFHHARIDPATRTFQALRMAVNGEVDNLNRLLSAVPGMMNADGTVAIIGFHSGEDRPVKLAMRTWRENGLGESLTKKPVEASDEELRRNPRSRSAKLRAFHFGLGKDVGPRPSVVRRDVAPTGQ